MAATVGPGGPSTATKIAADGPGGPLAAGDQLRRDRTSHTCMGYPVRVWDNTCIMSHTRMGVPHEYACMIVHSYATCTPGIKFCLLTKY